ncbi:MAG: tartrate dehydrogenase [Bryobacterales bacterium]|nr:tartrate dehydrogenase [Bryobacterales bacterium]
MKTYRIDVLAGDGIGVEVTASAMKVLTATASKHGFAVNYQEHDWGSDHFFRNGRMMPVNALDTLSGADAILLGAVGHPDIPDHVTLHGMLLPIRRGFDQYVNVRPAVLYEGVESPLKGYPPRDIDMVVIRENTEGEYAPIGGFVHHHHPGEVAVQTSVFTRHGCERVIRYAFELARKRNKQKRVTSITKSNAQAYSMVLWDRVFLTVANDFPDIETESLLVDAAAMNFVRRPHSFDVVVASNLFGDILSDVSAIVTGSIGLASSANLDPSRKYPSLFEPVHGSAPDIAGRGIANPLAAILSVAAMLDHLGETSAAAAVDHAVRTVLAAGKVRTPDLGGMSSTVEVQDAVIGAVTG